MTKDLYYPSLDSLLPLNRIPEQFGNAKELLADVFDELYYSDFSTYSSNDGATRSFNVTIITPGKLGFDLPGGNGTKLVFMPGDDGKHSAIPLSVTLNWPVLKYIRSFNLANFGWDFRSFFEIFIEFSGINPADLMSSALKIVFDDMVNPIIKLKDRAKDEFDIELEIPNGPLYEQVLYVIDQLHDAGENIYEFIYKTVLKEFQDIEIAEIIDKLIAIFSTAFNNITLPELKEILIPRFELEIDNIAAALEFSRKVMKPTDESLNYSQLSFNAGAVSVSTEEGFEFHKTSNLNFTESEILESGFSVGFTDMELDLSRSANIEAADADGRPADFMGVYVKDATIGFPAFWKEEGTDSTAELYGENLLIGTGGLTGKIGMRVKTNPDDDSNTDVVEPLISTTFGSTKGFKIALEQFSMAFQQNSITEAEINGWLTIPGLKDSKDKSKDAKINVDIGFANGEYSITASVKSGLEFEIPDVMTITVFSLSVGKKKKGEEDAFYLSITGEVTLESLGVTVGVKELRIWGDGQVELPNGGYVQLDEPVSAKFGPAELGISGIHIGSEERSKNGENLMYKYFGLDGGIKMDPGGVDARGTGLKLYWAYYGPNKDQLDIFFRIESLAIDITIPGNAKGGDIVAKIGGFLAMGDDDSKGPEYTGGVSVQLPKAGLGLSGAIRFRPQTPAFLVDVAVDLPAPIPLGATGTGIYGFRGLLGKEYVPDYEAHGRGLDFYKKIVPPLSTKGVHVGKFNDLGGFAVGAGMSLATAFDSGKVISTRLMAMISSPGGFELIGDGQMLKERVALADNKDLPFAMALSISDAGVYFGAEVDIKVPEDNGAVLKIGGALECAFPFDGGAWYVNVGTEEKPISAQLLTIFNTGSWFMISPQGINIGSILQFKKLLGNRTFGVSLDVGTEIRTMASFKPFKVGGSIRGWGSLEIYVFKFTFGISGEIGFMVSAPDPVVIAGHIAATFKLKILFVKISIGFSFDAKLEFKGKSEPAEVVFLENPAKSISAFHMLTQDPFNVEVEHIDRRVTTDPDYNEGEFTKDNTIPIDSTIQINFSKGVGVSSDVSGIALQAVQSNRGNIEEVPPVPGVNPQITHVYQVSELTPYILGDDKKWHEYDPYEALQPDGAITEDWQKMANGKYWSAFQLDGEKLTTLHLMTNNAMNYTQSALKNPILEKFDITTKDLYCKETKTIREHDPVDELRESSFKNGTLRRRGSTFSSGLRIRPLRRRAKVVDRELLFPTFSKKAVRIADNNTIELRFPADANDIDMRLLARYKVGVQCFDAKGKLVKELVATAKDAATGITYLNSEVPIRKVVLTPVPFEISDEHIGELDEDAVNWLLKMLNGQVTDKTLTVTDPHDGEDLELNSVITTHLPPDETTCNLHLESNGLTLASWGMYFQPYGFTGSKIINVTVGSRTEQFITYAKDRLEMIDDFIDFLTEKFSDMLVNIRENCNTVYAQAANHTIDHLSISTDVDSPYPFQFIRVFKSSAHLFDYKKIVRFFDVRPDLSSLKEGANYGFLVLAELDDGTIVDLKGSTDIFHLYCVGDSKEKYKEILHELKLEWKTISEKIKEYEKWILEKQGHNSKLSIQSQKILDIYDPYIEKWKLEIEKLKIKLEKVHQLIIKWTEIIGEDGCTGGFPVIDASYFFCIDWTKQFDIIKEEGKPILQESKDELSQLVAEMNADSRPIWRPNSTFLVKLETYDKIPKDDQKYYNTYYIKFKTEGPVGHLDNSLHNWWNKITKDDPSKTTVADDEFRLTNLNEYLDFPKCYPNADGNLVNAKPLYYDNPSLHIFGKPSYWPFMYMPYKAYAGNAAIPKSENQLKAAIIDPETNDRKEIPDMVSAWEATTQESYLPIEIKKQHDLYNGIPCNQEVVTKKTAYVFKTQIPIELDPEKLYTAQYSSVYKGKGSNANSSVVHTHPFQTSRYANFHEHIRSIYSIDPELLGDDDSTTIVKSAVSTLLYSGKGDSVEAKIANIDLARKVIAKTLDMTADAELIRSYQDRYDRLLFGALKLEGFEAADSTEITFVENGVRNDGSLIGVLIRSNEAFNDPRIPMETLLNTFSVFAIKDGTESVLDKMVLSKDGTTLFATNSAMNCDMDAVRVVFDTIEYTQNGYAEIADKQEELTVERPEWRIELHSSQSVTTDLSPRDNLFFTLVTDADGRVPQFVQYRITDSETESVTVVQSDTFDCEAGVCVLPLTKANLAYGSSYTVEPAAMYDGTLQPYSAPVTITTKEMMLVFTTPAPASSITGGCSVALAIQDNDGITNSSFNGWITLEVVVNGTTRRKKIFLKNGVASTVLYFEEAGDTTVLAYADETSGIRSPESVTVVITDPVQRLRMVSLPINPVTVGSSIPVTVEAQNLIGAFKDDFNATVTVYEKNSSGAIIATRSVVLIDGVGIFTVTSGSVGTVSLEIAPQGNLDVKQTAQITFE